MKSEYHRNHVLDQDSAIVSKIAADFKGVPYYKTDPIEGF